MMRVAALALACLGSPAFSQTLAEAAKINMQLAIKLCIDNYRTPDQMRPAFAAAGFEYKPEFMGGEAGDAIHWYHAPADTMTAIVAPGPGKSYCSVMTRTMGVTEAISFAGIALETLYAGRFSYGEAEGGAPVTPVPQGQFRGECTGYIALLPQRFVSVKIGNEGQDPGCIEDGTSQIMINM